MPFFACLARDHLLKARIDGVPGVQAGGAALLVEEKGAVGGGFGDNICMSGGDDVKATAARILNKRKGKRMHARRPVDVTSAGLIMGDFGGFLCFVEGFENDSTVHMVNGH